MYMMIAVSDGDGREFAEEEFLNVRRYSPITSLRLKLTYLRSHPFTEDVAELQDAHAFIVTLRVQIFKLVLHVYQRPDPRSVLEN